MTTRNWERPDDEAQAETPPVPLEPPAVGRLAEIAVPTLVILGALERCSAGGMFTAKLSLHFLKKTAKLR
jgi:hypothetical protein